VAVSSNIIKSLEEREWIRVVGHRDVPGKPALFGTTKGFLDYFGLKRLDELPPLSELKEIGELEPQFQFDGQKDSGPANGEPADGQPIAAGGIGHGDDVPPPADEHTPDAAPEDRAAEADDSAPEPDSEPDPTVAPEPQTQDDDAVPASSEQEK
jgi:segregation and condensation protein B